MYVKKNFDGLQNDKYWCAGYALNANDISNQKAIKDDVAQFENFYTFMSFEVKTIEYICYIIPSRKIIFTVTNTDDQEVGTDEEFLEFSKTDKYKKWLERSIEIIDNNYKFAQDLADNKDKIKEMKLNGPAEKYIKSFVDEHDIMIDTIKKALSSPKSIFKSNKI